MRLSRTLVHATLFVTGIAALSGCALLKKVPSPWRKKPKATPAFVAAQPQLVGTVVLVDEDTRFVLIDAGNSPLPPEGTALKTMSGETETGVIAVGDVRKRPFAVADIVRGEPRKGDGVFQ